jgi:hypothetical protein
MISNGTVSVAPIDRLGSEELSSSDRPAVTRVFGGNCDQQNAGAHHVS